MSSDQPHAIEMSDSVDTSDLVHPDVQRHIHKALQTPDTIRVLELLPGSSESTLSCRILEIHRTNSDVEFEAISYVWGSPNPACYLHDVESNGLLRITESLYLALRAMRYPDRSRILWADAVCINQSDNDEKSHQVKNMGSIYATARRVMVWLGNENFSEAFKALEGLEKAAYTVDSTANLEFICPVYNVMMSVLRIIGRPWFTRLWTIQEFILAKDVRFCAGNQHISDLVLERAIKYTSPRITEVDSASSLALEFRHSVNMFNMVKNLFYFRVVWEDGCSYSGSPGVSLYECCQWVHSIPPKCTDERDQIYALLGLVQGPTRIVPNYSLTVTNVFLEFTWSEITAGNIDILRDADFRGQDDLYPSFLYRPHYTSDKIRSDTEASRTGMSRVTCAELIRPASIKIRGVIVDRISGCWKPQIMSPSEREAQIRLKTDIHQTLEDFLRSAEVVSSSNIWLKDSTGLLHTLGTNNPTGTAITNLLEVFCKIQACADRITDQNPTRKNMTPERIQKQFWRVVTWPKHPPSPAMPEDFRHLPSDYAWDNVYSYIFTTVKGYMGRAPKQVMVDDLVVIFDGGSVPFVLRQAHDSIDVRWKLIGECYVDGWMDGSYYGHEVVDDVDQYLAAADAETDTDFSYRKKTLLSEYFVLC